MKNGSPAFFLPLVLITIIGALSLRADDPAPAEPVNAAFTLDNYQAAAVPENIAPTPATQPNDNISVVGQPRNSTGHPCTLLDQQDIADLKKGLETNADEKTAFATLKASADARIAKPLNVPIPQKGPDGNWMYPGDFPVNLSPFGKPTRANEANATDMANLGMMYQLTGDEKYADFCKQMLLAYADSFNEYGHPPKWNHRFATDGRLTYQFLDDGFWLIKAAFAYDMVYSLPSWTAQERAHVRDDLFKAVAFEFSDPVQLHPAQDYLSSTHNRSALCTSGVLIAGYATEDPEMINNALYGTGGTKDAPKGGLIQVHFGDTCILQDGLWTEGAPAYQTGIASCGLFNDAEVMWHHGLDLYRYRGGVLKRLLDSAIVLSYPNPTMTVAALHDSGQFALLDSRAWLNNEVGVPYECGYRRYQDPSYIPIIQNATKTLSLTVHSGGPSLFLDLPPAASAPARPITNANFYSVGYGVLRTATPSGGNQVIQEYGPSGGHSHPSKLGIDVYALGDVTMPYPGVIFPYGDPLDFKWYWTTLANCDLTVDEQSQIYAANHYKFPKGTPDPVAQQLVYGPGATFGIERAWSNTLYTGVIQDRSLFLTPDYLADIFAAFSGGPHKYDLAWHLRGTMTTTLNAAAYQFPDPVANGYNAINNLTHASSDQAWTATVTTPNNQTVRFLAAGGTATDIYLGTGHFFTKSVRDDENPPVIVQRRADTNSVLFGNAADLSGAADGFLKSVAQEGSLDTGYGLLKVTTAKGVDLCFTAFRPGSYAAGGLNTDALQAFVRMDGTAVQSMYLAGGTKLKTTGGAIQRSVAGLASVEKSANGTYLVANPSPAAATITVTLPALAGLKAYKLDDQGKRTGPATVTPGAAGAFSLQMEPASKVEFGS
jgi:hypothetical protein